MEISGIEPEFSSCKTDVLPTKPYPPYPKSDLNTHEMITQENLSFLCLPFPAFGFSYYDIPLILVSLCLHLRKPLPPPHGQIFILTFYLYGPA